MNWKVGLTNAERGADGACTVTVAVVVVTMVGVETYTVGGTGSMANANWKK